MAIIYLLQKKQLFHYGVGLPYL